MGRGIGARRQPGQRRWYRGTRRRRRRHGTSLLEGAVAHTRGDRAGWRRRHGPAPGSGGGIGVLLGGGGGAVDAFGGGGGLATRLRRRGQTHRRRDQRVAPLRRCGGRSRGCFHEGVHRRGELGFDRWQRRDVDLRGHHALTRQPSAVGSVETPSVNPARGWGGGEPNRAQRHAATVFSSKYASAGRAVPAKRRELRS